MPENWTGMEMNDFSGISLSKAFSRRNDQYELCFLKVIP